MASIIDDFLTETECEDFIKQQSHFERSIVIHDKKKTGNSFQMLVDTGDLEDLVIKRITEWALAQGGKYAEDAKKWTLYSRIRLVHYSAGQEKSIHRDTVFYDRKNNTNSAYTCIVYLNEGFPGGRTITYPHVDQSKLGNLMNLRGHEDSIKATESVAVTPKTGRAVIYPINLVHEGEKVLGEKWLIIFKLQLPHN